MKKLKINERVENILKASVRARNDDRELLLIYLQKSGMNLSQQQIDIFRSLPAFETITRVRRDLQMQGKYPASPEVEEARYKKFQEVRHNINHENPEVLLERQGKVVLPWGQ